MKRPRRKQVRDETMKLLLAEGMTGWKIRYNSRLSRALGRCIPSQKTIEYQPRYMEQNDWEQVRGTILHEAAHAISIHRYGIYAGGGHGGNWARVARELGLDNPSAINRTATLTKKFTGTCPGCNRTVQKDRRASNACGKCCNEHAGGLYSPRFAFVWTRNA